MSKPQSGTWVGNVVNLENGSSAEFVMSIQVSDDGSFRGTIMSNQLPSRASEDGNVEGRYSPYGTLHLRYTPDKGRLALFDGRFEAPSEKEGIIYGTMLLSVGERHQRAAASLLLLSGVEKAKNGHVWGN